MKNEDRNTLVIIVAGGSGTRVGESLPKQFVEINGKPVIAYTIDKFQKSVYVSEIIVVVPKDFLSEMKLIAERNNFTKIAAVAEGGETRQRSVYNGLKEAEHLKHSKVLIHDAARPFVMEEDICNVVEGIDETGCAILTVPVTDSVKRLNAEGYANTLIRDELFAVQTPQGFYYRHLIKAHAMAEESGYAAYDDAELTEKIGIKTKLVYGGYHNFKITTAHDMAMAKHLLTTEAEI